MNRLKGTRRAWLTVAIPVTIVAVALAVWPGGGSGPVDRIVAPVEKVSGPLYSPEALGAIGTGEAGALVDWVDGVARAEWYEGVARQAWIDGVVRAEAERRAAAAAAARQSQAAPSSSSSSGGGTIVGGDVWARLAQCESGGNPATNTGNGFYGMYQFTLSTWQSVGGSGLPSNASAAEQTKRAQMLQARSGWGQWPACARKLGLL